jgi:DNA helicase II / ATP-dependent DNA helicase PcrA
MDRIEAARREAESIHRAAVALGDHPDELLALVRAEAGRRDVLLFGVPPGDSVLKSGLAVFDRQSKAIFYQDCGTDFDRAFLIAHELGHVILEGGTEDGVTRQVEPDRSIEDSPVGVDRVLDYGARERREAQMDLFARELLFPRTFALDLHIRQGLSSRTIAEKLRAPLSMVQQQLLDALLLPNAASPAQAAAEQVSVVPDDSQRAAAAQRGSPFLLQAGPGTGKTRTLVDRINRLIAEGVSPDSILVLTFSNKAAVELIDRISSRHPEAVRAMWIGTFHSFGLDIVRRFHDKLQLPPDPRVLDRTDAIELLEDEMPRLPLRHFRNLWDPTIDLADMLNAISRAKDEVVDAAAYRICAERMLQQAGPTPEERKPAEKCLEVAILFEAYEQLMAAEHALDFGDLVARPVRLLESDADVRAALQTRHRHILVDEYQDVNHASVRLLKAVAGDARNLWVVGDARQSIYRFRGAASTNVAGFPADFPGGTTGALEVNYRSTTEIVGTFSAFSCSMKASQGMLPLQLRAHRGSNQRRPELRTVDLPEDEISALAAVIREREQAGMPLHQQAVLCATNARVSVIAEGLEARGIPTLHLGSLFERSEVKDLLALLSLVVDTRAAGLTRVATIPGFTLPLQDVADILSHASEHEIDPSNWRHLFTLLPSLSAESHSSLDCLANLLDGIPLGASPWSVLAGWTIDKLGLGRSIHQSQDIASRMHGLALWQFLNFCRRQPARKGLPIRRLLDRIRRLMLLSEDAGLQQLPGSASSMNAVRLLTIHGAKGLEFHAVHLPGFVSTGMPRSYKAPRCLPPDGMIHTQGTPPGDTVAREGHAEEEECIFFVALSRARTDLFLYSHRRQSPTRQRSPSDYQSRISAHLIINNSPPMLVGPPKLKPLVPITWQQEPAWNDSQIHRFEGCPRRFFYTHVLRLPGRRMETPFLQMHSVVFEVLHWLKEKHAESYPSEEETNVAFGEAWRNCGPVDHGYAAEYMKIGRRLIEYFLEVRRAGTIGSSKPLSLSWPNCKIVVTPDLVITDPAGKVVVRRIKSGKEPSRDLDDLEYAILQMAVSEHYGPGARVEISFLASESSQPPKLSATQIANRKTTLGKIATGIRDGDFPAKADDRTCPRCPALFVCGALPAGSLQIKI